MSLCSQKRAQRACHNLCARETARNGYLLSHTCDRRRTGAAVRVDGSVNASGNDGTLSPPRLELRSPSEVTLGVLRAENPQMYDYDLLDHKLAILFIGDNKDYIPDPAVFTYPEVGRQDSLDLDSSLVLPLHLTIRDKAESLKYSF